MTSELPPWSFVGKEGKLDCLAASARAIERGEPFVPVIAHHVDRACGQLVGLVPEVLGDVAATPSGDPG